MMVKYFRAIRVVLQSYVLSFHQQRDTLGQLFFDITCNCFERVLLKLSSKAFELNKYLK